MPRRNRNLVDGGYYHILTRGNDRRVIFKDDQDYGVFLCLIKKYLDVNTIFIMHYCLMNNHIHLLIHVPIAKELPKFMQGILQSYAHYFRKKYDSSGFVFQNRYKSLLIDSEKYLLEAARYIERNPVRAGAANDSVEYPWSSYRYYACGRKDKVIKNLSWNYLDLGNTPEERQKRYREFVRLDRVYDELVDEVFRLV